MEDKERIQKIVDALKGKTISEAVDILKEISDGLIARVMKQELCD